MKLIDKVVDYQNLIYAWQKVRDNILEMAGWADMEELSRYEALLDQELKYIHDQFLKCAWAPDEMMPLPWPKITKTKEGKEIKVGIRQMFWVSVRDQVAWVAIVNVIGEIIDPLMPEWSIANRLYRSCWYDDPQNPDEDKKGKLRIGPYRHYNGKIYRHWTKSWARYRRLSYLTWLSMKKGNNIDNELKSLPEVLQQEFNDSKNSLKYLSENYWKKAKNGRVFWAKLDFEKFYPRLKRKAVIDGVKYGLELGQIDQSDIAQLSKLLGKMMDFSWQIPRWSKNEIKLALLNKRNAGIPTGLLVSHFLANVAMLPIDRRIDDDINKQNPAVIAHFRYVDDHLVLSTDFKKLQQWITEYKNAIRKIGAKLNIDKIKPKSLIPGYKLKKNEKVTDWAINPNNPVQLKTQTLDLISAFAEQDFGLLHSDEQDILLKELEHLLKTDLDDEEIRQDTRQTFAIYRIIRLIVDWQRDWSSEVAKQREIASKINDIEQQIKENIELANGKVRDLNSKKRRILKKLVLLQKNIQFPDIKTHERMIKRIFKDLLDTIKRYPDKKGLWGAAIDFCKSTGYLGCNEICGILNKEERAYKYLRAYIWQKLGNAIMETARTKNNAYIYSWEKAVHNKFYRNAPKWINKLKPTTRKLEYYEANAWHYLQHCVTLGKYISNGRVKHPIFPYSRPDLYFWSEMRLIANYSSQPSELMERYLSRLEISSNITKALKLRYIKFIKTKQEVDLIGKDYGFNDMSWVSPLGITTTNANNEFSLYEWCSWLQKTEVEWNKAGIYDSRMSEWTALEITKQVCEKYISSNIISIDVFTKGIPDKLAKILPNPHNVILDKNVWQRSEATWLNWGKDIVNTVKLENNVKTDPLLSNCCGNNQNSSLEHNYLYGCGLLLLGILRRNFDWPSIWNLPGHTRDWKGITKNFIDESPCSTVTMSILITLLMPKSIENKRLGNNSKIFDDDTKYDPDPIGDIANLIVRINEAQGILEDNQIMSFKNKPRQLIPIQLPDIIKRNWFND